MVRDDELGVINGSVATVTRVREKRAPAGSRYLIDANVAGRRICFDPMRLADAYGRPRLGWTYASTIAGAQGLTVDHAVVLIDPAFNRHDIYVAASRARMRTTLLVSAHTQPNATKRVAAYYRVSTGRPFASCASTMSRSYP